MTVMFPYDGKLEDDLAMKPDDVITVDDWNVSDDWAKGTLNGKTGLFYKAFTKPSSEVPSPDFILLAVRGNPEGYEVCYQGREYILKEEVDEVECIICQELANSAHQTSCCGNTVCLQCTSKWKEKSNSCPQCRKQPLEIVVDPKTQRRITGATVYCPNYHFGCDWVDGFGRVAQHLAADCEYEGKKCPNLPCEEVVPKTFCETHVSKLCMWRCETCPCCGKKKAAKDDDSCIRRAFARSLTYHDIINDHHNDCPEWPARCPNLCGPYLTLTQSSVDRHVKEECPETFVDCKFAEVGCKEKVKRQDLAQHMQESLSDHVTALFEDHMKLKHENAQLKRELNQLKPKKK